MPDGFISPVDLQEGRSRLLRVASWSGAAVRLRLANDF